MKYSTHDNDFSTEHSNSCRVWCLAHFRSPLVRKVSRCLLNNRRDKIYAAFSAGERFHNSNSSRSRVPVIAAELMQYESQSNRSV